MKVLIENKMKIIIILFSILVLGVIGINVIGGVPSFDGGMNVQTAENLLKDGSYSVNYPKGSFFDVKIQTGITVNLPTAVIFKLFGKSLGNSVIINVVYIILLLISISILFKSMKIDNKWTMVVLTMFLFTPYFFEYSMGLYGEIATLAWIILSIIFLEKSNENNNKYFFISGCLYALAYLTKTVALICIPAIIIVFIYKLLFQKDIKVKNIVYWSAGFLAPIILFELYKLVQLGMYEYYLSWKELLRQILTESGVKEGEIDTSNKILKLIKHINIFSRDFNINPVIFISILVANFYMFLHRIYKEKVIRYFDILVIVAFSYFGWWLIITTDARAWPRRIIIGVLLMECVSVYNILYLKHYLKNSKINKVINGVVIITLLWLVGSSSNSMLDDMNRRLEEKQSIIKISNKIKELGNDANFLGFGWWQAPVIAFESNKVFDNYYEIKDEVITKDTYLVVDRYAKLLAEEELNAILLDTDNELIYADDIHYYYIYKIKGILPYQEFTASEIEAVRENNYDMHYEYEYIRGVYDYEEVGDLRWSKKNSCILLRNNLGTNDIKLNLSYQIRDYSKFIDEKPTIRILVNDKEVYSRYIEHDGIYDETIDLNGIIEKDEVAEIVFHFDTKIKAEGDGRELAFILRNIALVE